MTTYILNSGGMHHAPDKGKKFFSEIMKRTGPQPRILICAFAQPREDWEQKFAQDVMRFDAMFQDETRPFLELAFPDTFEDQVRRCDALYIHGGDDHLVQYWLRKFDVPGLWEGKVVATNSASSHALSQSFWTCDWRQCMDGLGILPIKFLAHYQSEYGADDPRGPIDWEAAHACLGAYGDQHLPIFALKEGEYAVFEVENTN